MIHLKIWEIVQFGNLLFLFRYMKLLLFIFCQILACHLLYSQKTLTSNINQDQLRKAEVLTERLGYNSSLVKSYFLFDDFKNSNILLSTEELVENIYVKPDFHNHYVVIFENEKNYIIDNKFILNLELFDGFTSRSFKTFSIGNQAVLGEALTKSIPEERFQIFKFIETYIERADYNAALGIGTKDDRVISKPFYGIWDKEADKLLVLPNSKKKCKEYLNTQNLGITSKQLSKVNPKKIDSIKEFVQILNGK